GLALGYSLLGHGPDPPEDAYIRAKAAALRALELDPSLAEAHASIAQIKLYQDWEWDAAKKAFQYALSFNSSLADTRAHYSWYLQLFGQTEEALAEMKRAKEADPLTPLWSAWLGWQLWNAGQFDEAINEANKSFELDADFTVGFFVAGSAYASKGMFEEAIKLHKRAGEIDPNWKFALALTYAMAGQNDEAEKILAELEAAYSTWNTLFIAQIYSVLGDKDKAFQWIEEAYEKPSHPYMPWIKNMPAFKRLQNDTRFNELLQRMNLPVIEDPIM
ncbi:MAG: hypothetical protein IH947_12385, partial [Bacteroidetes bacterium]|nr:hypothetical protein [Bacteroidota bacterium]